MKTTLSSCLKCFFLPVLSLCLGSFASAAEIPKWVDLFNAHDVAGAPVHDARSANADPHFAARDLWIDPVVHGVRLLGSPLRVDGRMAVSDRAAPGADADREHVLRNVLGYDEARIASLRGGPAPGEQS